MRYRIKIEGLADGRPTPVDGSWLKWMDFDARDGRGVAQGTFIPEHAMVFSSHAEALTFWQTQSKVRPLRPDGKPNRPLTAYTVTVEPEP